MNRIFIPIVAMVLTFSCKPTEDIGDVDPPSDALPPPVGTPSPVSEGKKKPEEVPAEDSMVENPPRESDVKSKKVYPLREIAFPHEFPFKPMTTRIAEDVSMCSDADQRCATWAELDECDKNPGYMLKNCINSCFSNCPGFPEVEMRRASLAAEKREFYKHISRHSGFLIFSSENVSYEVHDRAMVVIRKLLATIPEVFEKFVSTKTGLAIIGKDERTTQLPEYMRLPKPTDCNCPDLTANEYWDVRSRGFGARGPGAITSVGEENILQIPGSRAFGESILIHEIGHTINMMLRLLDPQFDGRQKAIFERAQANGLWANTYAMTNANEYFAEGFQSYFNSNLRPQLGVHNEVRTRQGLYNYDRELYDLINRAMKGNPWVWRPASSY